MSIELMLTLRNWLGVVMISMVHNARRFVLRFVLIDHGAYYIIL